MVIIAIIIRSHRKYVAYARVGKLFRDVGFILARALLTHLISSTVANSHHLTPISRSCLCIRSSSAAVSSRIIAQSRS